MMPPLYKENNVHCQQMSLRVQERPHWSNNDPCLEYSPTHQMPMTSSFPHRKGILKSLFQQKPVNENSGLADGVDHLFGLNGPHDDLKGVAAPPGYESPPRRSIPQS